MSPGLLATIATGAGFRVVERATIPAREADIVSVPQSVDPRIRDFLRDAYPQGLFSHQAGAMSASLAGSDVVLSTSTASGKSLAFMTFASHLLLGSSEARVLALYPARALIQDQLGKWKVIARSFDLRVGFIEGGVRTELRGRILSESDIILMTPDVAHAWLLGRCGERDNADFLGRLRLLVLDEAHVYDGVFGTNMAFFLRRLEAVAAQYQIICSTATLGSPAEFVRQLTGRTAVAFGPDDDGSPAPEKTLLLARDDGGNRFEGMGALIRHVADSDGGRFLAFADSRKMVELLVSSSKREDAQPLSGEVEGEAEGSDTDHEPSFDRVLPYRSGYETEDRQAIQRALEGGELAGVVSTSALELGLDIGQINTILLLSFPPAVSAFWQRIGRAGRREPGVCLLLQDSRALYGGGVSLAELLTRPVEPNWLYLENRYIQYANALCAAQELEEAGPSLDENRSFESLPEGFRALLNNELNPSEPVPPELYPLKQRGQGGPHYEFPLRTGIEQQLAITGPFGKKLGTVTLSQALREAYPGAIYYYMARPYRVNVFNIRGNQIEVRRERRITTKPISQSMVFPRFHGGMLRYWRGPGGFVAESELQVSERVLGFVEQRGSARNQHTYDVGSSYYQRPLNRFFQTTGVSWRFEDPALNTEPVAAAIAAAFCIRFGVQRRDVGVGKFHSNQAPPGQTETQGWCVYDATLGSLRLTERLATHFDDVAAVLDEVFEEEGKARRIVRALREAIALLEEVQTNQGATREDEVTDTEWAIVIAEGERGIYQSSDGAREVQVIGYRYTPTGLMYELEPPPGHGSWRVQSHAVEPVHGQTRLVRYNLFTGEIEDLPNT